jgi:hypothetical protein
MATMTTSCSFAAVRSAAAASRSRTAAAVKPHHNHIRLSNRFVVLRRQRRHAGGAVAALPSLLPANADDALGRYRKVMTGLYAAGGLLHVPDLLGKGPISAAMGTSSFWELSPLLQAVTVGWAVLGPVAAVGLGTGQVWGEAILVAVASAEIVLGVDFSDAMGAGAIPREAKNSHQ